MTIHLGALQVAICGSTGRSARRKALSVYRARSFSGSAVFRSQPGATVNFRVGIVLEYDGIDGRRVLHSTWPALIMAEKRFLGTLQPFYAPLRLLREYLRQIRATHCAAALEIIGHSLQQYINHY